MITLRVKVVKVIVTFILIMLLIVACSDGVNNNLNDGAPKETQHSDDDSDDGEAANEDAAGDVEGNGKPNDDAGDSDDIDQQGNDDHNEAHGEDDTAFEPYTEVKASEALLPSLYELFKDDFDIGVAINNSQLTSPLDGPIVLKHFNSITAENHMKIDAMHPTEDMFRWDATDEMIAFAEEHRLQVRGHTLVWHSQVPSWIFVDEQGEDVSRDVLLERMKTHIQTIVSRYKGKVQSWDVLNEIIEPNDGRADGLRESKWLEIIGEDYIEHALRFAHEADPEAKLYINDYNTHEFRKREALLNLVTRLLGEDVPLHGVGHQMHVNIEYPSLNLIDQSLKVFAELGLDNQITEMDMSIYNNDSTKYDEVPERLLTLQAKRYQDMFNIFLKYRDHISSVTFWGLTDDQSWLRTFPVKRNNWPLLFNEVRRTKPVYWALTELAAEHR